MHGGRLYDARFGKRMRGAGPHAWMTWRRFELACRKLGLGERVTPLDTSAFSPPEREGGAGQMRLPGI